MRDDAGEATGDSVWLTYAELGKRLGISAASAKRRANRRRWAKRLNNAGLSTVAVPRDVLEAGPHRQIAAAGDAPEDAPGDAAGGRTPATPAPPWWPS